MLGVHRIARGVLIALDQQFAFNVGVNDMLAHTSLF
jgi:hypothetical protein